MGTGLEIERKFIIKMPKVETLELMPGFTASEILQIYLENTKEGATHRIRRRTYRGKPSEYTENTKKRVDGMSVIEWETEITAAKFKALSAKMEQGTTPLYKTRYTLDFAGKIIEIDVYPKWKKSCVMEVELSKRDEELVFPTFIKIIKEVTGDKGYSNHSMAKGFPEEII